MASWRRWPLGWIVTKAAGAVSLGEISKRRWFRARNVLDKAEIPGCFPWGEWWGRR